MKSHLVTKIKSLDFSFLLKNSCLAGNKDIIGKILIWQ